MTQSLSSLRLTFLLDWPERDKSLLLAAATVPFQLLACIWLWYTGEYTQFGVRYFSPEGVDLFYTVLWGVILGWLLIFGTGVLLRHFRRDPWLFSTTVIYYYGLSMLAQGYVIGLVTPVTGMVMLGATLVGFALYDFPRVLVAFFLNLAVMMVMTLAVATGKVPYAPLFVSDPLSAEDMSGYWLISQCLVASPFLAATFGITRLLIVRWHQREVEARELAHSDPMTGVANRAAIMTILKHELASTRRNSRPFAVVMLDLDHFKSINDTYGHDAGDAILVATARAVEATLRESDWVGRFGSDELVLVLPQTDADTALLAVERLRNALSTLLFDMGSASQVRVTASIGICEVDGVEGSQEPPVERVLMRVEAALRMAKAEGGNRFSVWRASTSEPVNPAR